MRRFASSSARWSPPSRTTAPSFPARAQADLRRRDMVGAASSRPRCLRRSSPPSTTTWCWPRSAAGGLEVGQAGVGPQFAAVAAEAPALVAGSTELGQDLGGIEQRETVLLVVPAPAAAARARERRDAAA